MKICFSQDQQAYMVHVLVLLKKNSFQRAWYKYKGFGLNTNLMGTHNTIFTI